MDADGERTWRCRRPRGGRRQRLVPRCGLRHGDRPAPRWSRCGTRPVPWPWSTCPHAGVNSGALSV